MISKSGWTPFATDISSVGGMEELVETNISRNLWAIMDKFKVLPTNPDFQKLTQDQVHFIIGNMSKDVEIRNLIARGLDPDKQVKDRDNTWWDTPIDEFDPKGNLDIDNEDIAAQVEALTSKKDRKRLAKASDGSKEWAEYLEKEGNEANKLSVERQVQENLEKARNEAKMLEDSGINNWGKPKTTVEEKERAKDFEPITQEDVEAAFKLFEGEDMKEDTGPDSEWI